MVCDRRERLQRSNLARGGFTVFFVFDNSPKSPQLGNKRQSTHVLQTRIYMRRNTPPGAFGNGLGKRNLCWRCVGEYGRSLVPKRRLQFVERFWGVWGCQRPCALYHRYRGKLHGGHFRSWRFRGDCKVLHNWNFGLGRTPRTCVVNQSSKIGLWPFRPSRRNSRHRAAMLAW